MTKYIILTFIIFTTSIIRAQLVIDKQTISESSTLFEFNDLASNNKGIILPALETIPTFVITPGVSSPNNGTFLYDRTDKKVKMFQKNIWVDLSTAGNDSQIVVNESDESLGNQGVIIGSSSSRAKGVLVLESSNSAMILPHIANPHTTVINPYPGMICYDTVSKSLAVFDGNEWHYWK